MCLYLISDPNYTSSITQRNENAQPVVDYELSRGHQRTSTLWTIFIIVLPVALHHLHHLNLSWNNVSCAYHWMSGDNIRCSWDK